MRHAHGGATLTSTNSIRIALRDEPCQDHKKGEKGNNKLLPNSMYLASRADIIMQGRQC
jgi:hypothetical protein